MSHNPSITKGYQLACKAREGAYAPYSNFSVGAALKISNLDIYFSGCNVENASYGATVCAERTAIWKAVEEYGAKPEIEWLVLVTDTSPVSPPCGICLQVMSEFLNPDATIYLANLHGIQRALPFKELLPTPFKI